jgi:hypothetical protein
MRYLITLLFAALSFSAFSQNNAIHVYPWNPDANQDNSIGMGDMLSFLSVFGEEFGLPPEPCTYDGTDFEDLMFGIADGSIILDSLFIEYELEDVSTYYVVGCPDQITDTITISHNDMLSSFNTNLYEWQIYIASGNYYMVYEFTFFPVSGEYRINLTSYQMSELNLTQDGFFGNSSQANIYSAIPFPEDWYLDEEGIHIESGWDENDWPYYANYLHILPYWHYADE